MIHELDEAIKALIKRDAVNGSDVDITFDAPTKDWAAKRNSPTISVYLYDIREDVERREVMYEEIRDEHGRVKDRRPPPRRFKFSYLLTAWTQRPEDEHRILSSLLATFVRNDQMPEEVLSGYLASQDLPVITQIGLPPPKDRNLSDVWSALGGELKPSLDLIVVAPFDTKRMVEVGPPILEEPRLTVIKPDAEEEKTGGRKGKSPDEADEDKELIDETIKSGKEEQPGRIMRVRSTR